MGLREPLLVPLAALAAGIAAGRWLDMPAYPAAYATALLVCLAAAARRYVTARAACGAFFAAIATGGMWVEAIHRPGPPPTIDFEPGETLVLSGCVVEPTALSPDREQFVVELASRARVRVNWYVKEGEQAPGLHYGELVELEARLRPPRNFGNPGAFDFAGYLARRDIFWLATANSKSRLQRLEGRCGWRALSAIYWLRERSVDRLDSLFAADPYALGLSRAVLLGDTARLERVWAEDYRRTGTYHTIVISGIHLTVLAACFLVFFRLLGMTGLASLAITAAMCWIYALMTGAGAPVVRSAAGLTLFLGAHFLYRRARILNILAAVGILFLLADPDQLFEASFQLSFLAVALIGALAVPALAATTEPYADGLRKLADTRRDPLLPAWVAEMRVELRLLTETIEHYTLLKAAHTQRLLGFAGICANYAWTLFVVSAIIQLGMLLPMVAYFHRFSVTGLTANILIVPAMNLLVPVGFLAILTGWQWLGALAGWLLAIGKTTTAWHAQWEPGWRIPDPPFWLGVLFLASLAGLAVAVRCAGTRIRLAAVGGFLSSAVLLVAHPFRLATEPGWLEMTALDVGQGDSLLIASPEGKLMLFDTGGLPPLGKQRRPALDIGEDVVSPYLLTRSVKRLDIVALSHAHEDHIGGLLAIVRNFRPREVWTGAFPPTDSWRRMRAEIEAAGTRVVSPKAGETRLWGGIRVEVVSPPVDYTPGAQPKNNDSLGLLLRYRKSSLLMVGDLERAMELRLVNHNRLSRVDLLKVGHHGSRTSTTPPFLDVTRPTWAVISAGAGNLFRHPHPEVTKRLTHQGVSIWRTDLHGQVRFLTDGHRWRVEPYWLQGTPVASGWRRMVD